MRKRIVGSHCAQATSESDQGWLDLEEIATVEVTSEDPSFPIESAFIPNFGPGWRASQKGEQHIRIIFDEPMSLHRIQLRFHEPESERTGVRCSMVVCGRWAGERNCTPAMEL
jgi:hypothetical protein